MPDREKVVDYLQSEIHRAEQSVNDIWLECVEVKLLRDALALLKQEKTTFKPHYIDEYGKHFICGVECGACHKEISSTYHYCPWCGRTVTWDANGEE